MKARVKSCLFAEQLESVPEGSPHVPAQEWIGRAAGKSPIAARWPETTGSYVNLIHVGNADPYQGYVVQCRVTIMRDALAGADGQSQQMMRTRYTLCVLRCHASDSSLCTTLCGHSYALYKACHRVAYPLGRVSI